MDFYYYWFNKNINCDIYGIKLNDTLKQNLTVCFRYYFKVLYEIIINKNTANKFDIIKGDFKDYLKAYNIIINKNN